MVDKNTGKIHRDKFFMGMAVAIVFVIQAVHSMMIQDLNNNTMPKDEIMHYHKLTEQEFEDFRDRMAIVETKIMGLSGVNECCPQKR